MKIFCKNCEIGIDRIGKCGVYCVQILINNKSPCTRSSLLSYSVKSGKDGSRFDFSKGCQIKIFKIKFALFRKPAILYIVKVENVLERLVPANKNFWL
jgi:hypothetical protein